MRISRPVSRRERRRLPLPGRIRTAAPDGGQDILLAIEKISPAAVASALDEDEIWSETPRAAALSAARRKTAGARSESSRPIRSASKRIIVVKLDHRGDFMMAGQAFRMLRTRFESAEMTLVCGSGTSPRRSGSGLFRRSHPVRFFPEDDSARPETPPREPLIADSRKQMEGKPTISRSTCASTTTRGRFCRRSTRATARASTATIRFRG